MKLLRTLREKPWELASSAGDTTVLPTPPDAAAKTALRFIIAIVSVLFFLFIITFLSRSQYPDFQALAGAPWQPFTDPARLWINTAILACASLAMHYGLYGANTGKLNRCIIGVCAGMFFSVLFLLAQLDLWHHLRSMGFYASTNPANSYFYLLTAVHGLHIIGGLLAVAYILVRALREHSLAKLAPPLRLCTVYWHFLLLVWLVLFALLTSRAETINALAALCGF